jgi:hypothetical protein
MVDRWSNIVILAEDQEHQNLVWHYLKRCPANRAVLLHRTRKVQLPAGRGSGSQFVRERFSLEVAACRGRHASVVLIVITAADNLSIGAREQTLHDELAKNSQAAIGPAEPVAILVPKWQVETWVKCLHGETVREDDKDTDKPPVTPEQVEAAAKILYVWARPNAQIPAHCVDSLRSALPRWRKCDAAPHT